MIPQPPSGQGPVDPRGAFSPPPAPAGQGTVPPPQPMYAPPPPMMMPPPGFFPPPPKSGGFGKAILTTLATTIFGLSIALNIYFLIFSNVMGGGSARSDTLLEGDSH